MSIGLSYFVEDEINRMRWDDSFAHISHEIFSKMSEKESNFGENPFDMYDGGESIGDYYLKENKEPMKSFEEDMEEPKLFLSNLESAPILIPSQDSFKWKIDQVQNLSNESLKENSNNIQESLNNKSKWNRSIIPSEFLSLKRKDVVMKSIFRMMRRYYCKLLEGVTGYNRKEKCLQIKHKELLKSLKIGMMKLGFEDFSLNMAFYFGAFAYPSDMRKILEESKQQYRTQNEVLSQALYIVQLVDNCFNRFSKKVLNDILSIPQFSFFIQYYLTNVDDLSVYPKPFQNCYKTLIKAKENVDNYCPNTLERICRHNTFVLKEEFFLFSRSDSL